MVAFESGDPHCPRKVVFLGGLTGGLFGCPYVPALDRTARASGWSLVQPLLTSSLTGYGTGSLRRDSGELDDLLDFLCQKRNAAEFALVGHSTGCQQIAHYCSHGRQDLVARVKVAVLQAPVSDREGAATDPNTEQWLEKARGMQAQGLGEEFMPRAAHPCAPITANRFRSLFDRDGEDDFFSSDLSDEQLAQRLRPLGDGQRRVVIAFSEADQYVPPSIDREALVRRMCRAVVPPGGTCLCSLQNPQAPPDGGPAPTTACVLLPGANHNLSLPADGAATRAFLNIVARMLRG